MTREECAQVMQREIHLSPSAVSQWIRVFERLGMLKLDPPVSDNKLETLAKVLHDCFANPRLNAALEMCGWKLERLP